LRELRPGHTVACHYAEEILAGTIKPRSSEEVLATTAD
jgi:hypothetical protein